LALGAGFGPAAQAHPVPRRIHDRTVAVRLTADAAVVDYRLDVDEFTVVYVDLPAVIEKEELARLSTPAEFYDAFARLYAPILADNLIASLDGKPLTFRCVRRVRRTRDEDGTVLDHLRFDFRFQTEWRPAPGRPHQFVFREGNYELEDGTVRLSLSGDGSVRLEGKTEPDKKLQERRPQELQPGDGERLRKAGATFVLPAAAASAPAPAGEPPDEPTAEPAGRASLLNLLLDPRRGLWVLLALAAGFGAVHALTPGHGKTLVAAYLVGERGTVWHALVLGLVTTLTHTGAVLLLAGGLLVLYPDTVPAQVRTVLGFSGGLLVAGMGFWLFSRRLSGGPDHVHLGGSGHHHHTHERGGHVHAVGPAADAGGLWGLVVLGVSGGIVPCWDAIAMFGFAVSAQRVWLALPLLLAFSAGLAAVLIVLGVLVVQVKGFAAARWGGSGLVKALPLVSAVVVTALGLWLCYDSVHLE
jgi:ABC-type nickel/cobalt efflux system permease component RcnA